MSRLPARVDMKYSSTRSAVNVGSSSIEAVSDSAATSTGGENRGGVAGTASAPPPSEAMVPSNSLRTQANGPARTRAGRASLTVSDTFAIVES
jgi:hypothetical protein